MMKYLRLILSTSKIIFSLSALIILPFARGITYFDEIGIAMQPFIAFMAIFICSDLYHIERQYSTWEIFHIHVKQKNVEILKRFVVMQVFMLIFNTIMFFLFLIQSPVLSVDQSVFAIFVHTSINNLVTVFFMGSVSFLFMTVIKKLWLAIGLSLFLVIVMSSSFYENIMPQSLNLFAYGQKESWIVCMLVFTIMGLVNLIISTRRFLSNKYIYES